MDNNRNQSKSIEFVTSCAEHVDGMNEKKVDNNSSVTHQSQPKLFNQKVHGLVQLFNQKVRGLVQLLSKLRTRSQALFNEIIICAIFISVNAEFLSHELILVIHCYD